MKSFFAILGFIAVLNCAGIGYLCITHKNLEKRVKSLEFITENRTDAPFIINRPPFKYDNWMFEIDSLRRAIDLRDVKQQYYLTQLSIQSDWFIVFVTVLFGVFAVVGYGFFVAQTQAIAKQYEEQKKIQEQHITEVEKRFKKVEIKTLMAYSNIVMFQASYCFDKGEYIKSLDDNITALNVALEIKRLKEECGEEWNNPTMSNLSVCLSDISLLCLLIERDSDVQFYFTSSSAKNLKHYFYNLYSGVDEASKSEITKILSKIDEGITKANEIKNTNTPKGK